MSKKPGRPELPYEQQLKKVARLLANNEASSRHAAEKHVVTSEMPNATDSQVTSAVRRLERKWKEHGETFMAEAKKERAEWRKPQPTGNGIDLAHLARGGAARAIQDEVERAMQWQREIDRALNPLGAVGAFQRLQEQAFAAHDINEKLRATGSFERIQEAQDQVRQVEEKLQSAINPHWPFR